MDPKINPLNPEGLKVLVPFPLPPLRERNIESLMSNSPNHVTLNRCCACPETKKARDDCFLLYGSNADESSTSADKCKEIVDRHLECMRGLGFNM
jgi:cytochrome c oxidase assembly protein subunit 17